MTFQFPITIKIIHEPQAKDAPFVAYIPEFDISSCGRTEEKAVKNVREALEITLSEVKKQNKLDDFLRENGVSRNKPFMFPRIILEPFVFNA